MKVWKSIFVLKFLLWSLGKLSGQTCCSGGTPLLGNLGINSFESGTVYVQVAYDYNFLNDLYAGNESLDDSNRERLTQTAILQVVYPVTDKMAINGLFTYVAQERIIFTERVGVNQTNSKGMGDAVVLFQYSILSTFKRSLLLAAGPKLPIGKFDATDDEFDLVLSPDLQPGSGSFDGIFASSYNEYNLFSLPGLSLNASASYRLTSSAKRFEGDSNYRFGNETMFSLGFQKSFQVKRIGVTPSFFSQYRHTLPDKIDGLEVAGTGGNWIYLIPGLHMEFTNSLAMNAAIELPVYRYLEGTQLTTTYRLNVGLAIKIFNN